MRRDQIIDMLDEFAGPLGPFCSLPPGPFGALEKLETDRTQWVRSAPDEWLDILLDIAVNPPLYWDDGRSTEAPFDGHYELVLFLGEWGHLRSRGWAQKVGPLLRHKQARLTLLQAIAEARLKECVLWLAPLGERWQELELDTDELLWLVEAIDASGGSKALPLLERMQKILPPDKNEVHQQIQNSLTGRAWQHVPDHFGS